MDVVGGQIIPDVAAFVALFEQLFVDVLTGAGTQDSFFFRLSDASPVELSRRSSMNHDEDGTQDEKRVAEKEGTLNRRTARDYRDKAGVDTPTTHLQTSVRTARSFRRRFLCGPAF